MTAKIDFLVIGAQKAGTSSLFEYLRRHPQVHVPREKETFFFSEDRVFRRGWAWYIQTMGRNAPDGATCGEVSTTYMMGAPQPVLSETGHVTSPRPDTEGIVPQRIWSSLPAVKLICVLRDPVARAFSHHRMAVMERAESRPFASAIAELIEPRALEAARRAPTPTNGYIVNGEYGRALSGYLRTFPRDQLLVIYSDDLAADPATTMATIFEFIGVEHNFRPDNLGTRYRAAATSQRIPGFDLHAWRIRLSRIEITRKLWRTLPQRFRDSFDRVFYVVGYRLGLWNARRVSEPEEDTMDPTVQHALAAHFHSDSQRLSELIGMDVPWLQR